MQRAGDVPLNHLRTVAQHHQCGDGAEAAGLQVDGGAVIYLAVDDRVHQPHDLGRQLGHCRRWDRVVIGTVVPLPKFDGGLVQILAFFLQIILRNVFQTHGVSRFNC